MSNQPAPTETTTEKTTETETTETEKTVEAPAESGGGEAEKVDVKK